MAQTIILKNTLGNSLTIKDLGVTVPANGSVDLTGTTSLDDLQNSEELPGLVSTGAIVINDGNIDLDVIQGNTFIAGGLISPIVSGTSAESAIQQVVIKTLPSDLIPFTSLAVNHAPAINIPDGGVVVPFDTITVASGISFTANGGVATILTDGWYEVSYHASTQHISGASWTIARYNLQTSFSLQAFTNLNSMTSYTYTHNGSGRQFSSVSASTILKLKNQDRFRLVITRQEGSGTIQTAGNTPTLLITRIG